MRFQFSFSILAVALAVASGTAHARELRPTTLRLDFAAYGVHAPFYLGVAKGFYRDQGIDLKVFTGKGSANSATLAGTGADDFAFADATTTARMIAQGLPAKVVLGILQKPTLAVYVPADSKITTPADLKGKRISMCAGDGMAQYVPALLDAYHIPHQDVTFLTVDCSAKYAIVAKGSADAVASYTTSGSDMLASVGIPGARFFSFDAAGLPLPSHGIVAGLKLIGSDPGLIERFNKATVESWEAAQKDPDAAVTAFMAANPLQKGRETLVRRSLTTCFEYINTAATTGKPFGWQSPEAWNQAKALLVKYTGVSASIPTDKFYTNQFVPK